MPFAVSVKLFELLDCPRKLVRPEVIKWLGTAKIEQKRLAIAIEAWLLVSND
jgi:hypothetical protein